MFACSLAAMVYLDEIVKNLKIVANHVRPFDDLISIALLTTTVLSIYFAYHSNWLDRLRPRVYNPQYKKVDQFDLEKKM